ncbi:MAG: carboxypeptidase M32 [Thermoplasmatota archaeon]
MKDSAFDEMLEIYEEITRLKQLSDLLMWDQNTYMPPGSVGSRAAQNSLVTGLIHQRITSKRMGELLASMKESELSEQEQAMVREVRRDHERKSSIPEKLAREISKTEAEGTQIWVKAKQNNDFASFAPILGRMIDLKGQVTEHLGYAENPYDALLEDYEPYMTSREIRSIFGPLRAGLVNMVKKIADSGHEIDSSPIMGSFPKEGQESLSKRILGDMGYDFERGRLDVTEHPFTVGSMDDTRITTKYNIEDLRPGIFGSIHEGGHALYEQGFLEENYCSPLAESVSLGIHESQSRFWENIIGRSLPFWEHYLPITGEHFPRLKRYDPVDIYRAVNTVAPSLIRVQADEVTYNLHILIRFELETKIFKGELDVKDIPEAWNERYEEFLGLRPKTDTTGCLQDIHWAVGYFGYFPTYTLGNLYSAQILDGMGRDVADLHSRVKRGEFGEILVWLRSRIHRHGRMYPAKELIRRATGYELSSDHFLSYVKEKYSGIYGINL